MAKQTRASGRQWALEASQLMDKTFAGTGNELLIELPPGAYLNNVEGFVTTAFDGTTTVTVNATDGTTVFVAAQTVKVAGAVTAAVTKKYYPNGGTITVSIADASANSTVGGVIVLVQYIILNRANEAQGNG